MYRVSIPCRLPAVSDLDVSLAEQTVSLTTTESSDEILALIHKLGKEATLAA